MNLNAHFEFEGKLKRILLGGMVLGVVSLAFSLIGDDEYHTRFWTNWLHNSVYFTGIAFTAMLFLSAQITAFAGWMVTFKRVWEAMSQFMWVGLILMGVIVLGVWGHFHHLYHWNTPGISDPASPLYDKILAGKASFLNPVWFTVGVLGFLALWYYWAKNLHQASVDQDTKETPAFDYNKKQRKWAASFLPLGGFLSTVFIWQSVMSIDAHWYSTMFAWYSTISMLLGGISLTIMLLIYLKSLGYMEYITQNHLHDLGKYLFGISVFWTYLWFDQFMLIWYANVGEETIYFKERMNHYPVLFWGNLLLNFVVPFLILMRNDTKRKFGTMFFVSIIVFFGHWWDFFYMIKPGARIAAFEAKEIAEGRFGHQTEAAPISKSAPAASHDATTHAAEAAAQTTTPALAHDSTTHAAEGHAETAHAAAPAPSPAHDAHAEAGDSHGAAAAHHGPDKSFKMGYSFPGFPELGLMLGFLSLFLYFFFWQLSKSPLLPQKDPYLEESLQHDTGAIIEGEEGTNDHH